MYGELQYRDSFFFKPRIAAEPEAIAGRRMGKRHELWQIAGPMCYGLRKGGLIAFLQEVGLCKPADKQGEPHLWQQAQQALMPVLGALRARRQIAALAFAGRLAHDQQPGR